MQSHIEETTMRRFLESFMTIAEQIGQRAAEAALTAAGAQRATRPPEPTSIDNTISVAEAAKRAEVDPRTIANWFKDGRLTPKGRRGARRVDVTELNRWLLEGIPANGSSSRSSTNSADEEREEVDELVRRLNKK